MSLILFDRYIFEIYIDEILIALVLRGLCIWNFYKVFFRIKKKPIKAICSTIMGVLIVDILTAIIGGILLYCLKDIAEFFVQYGIIEIQLLLFIVTTVILRRLYESEDKKYYFFDFISWGIIFFSSVYIPMSVYDFKMRNRPFHIILGLIVLMVVVYDISINKIIDYCNRVTVHNLQEAQTKLYEQQLEYIEKDIQEKQKFRHDLKNHCEAILLLNRESTDEGTNYALQLVNQLNKVETIYYTGNSVIDSLIRSKVDRLEQMNVKVEIESFIHYEIRVVLFDLVTILGNLFDNAIEALSYPMNENGVVRVQISSQKGVLYIAIQNNYNGKSASKKKRMLNNSDRYLHGIGLRNVKETVERYSGTMKITNDNELFKVEIMMLTE